MIKGRLDALLRRLVWEYRQATWRTGSLPDFIIIGAQKSGTTSLYSYLSQHPQLLPSIHKAVHFFDGGLDESADNFEKGEAWYRAHFQLRMHAHERTFEASPLYIFNPLAPKRIYDLVPEAKIIAVLRNPTERAISQYFHEKGGKNRDPLSIREALREEETRLKAAVRAKDYKNDSFIHHSYRHCHVNRVGPQRPAWIPFQAAALALSHRLNASFRNRLNVSLLHK